MRYYFISDLHIGGDGGLDTVDFEAELIRFLGELRVGPKPAELIIVGDFLGLWELTRVESPRKVDYIAGRHAELFEAFRKTGEEIAITVVPGNHDYELACYPECEESLARFGIRLVRLPHITRPIAGRRIWIEHGNQHDPFNRFPQWGNPYGMPLGYFVTRSAVAATARAAEHARSEWLTDLESVYPNEHLPFWTLSNFFYREMAHVMRWAVIPFLVLLTVSAALLGGLGLERLGVLPWRIDTLLTRRLGHFGTALDIILLVNWVVILALLVLAIPAGFVLRDARRVLRRYDIDQQRNLKVQKEETYVAAARSVFAADTQVALFVYGHTHTPSLTRLGDRCILNTGSWLKRLVRVPTIVGRFPGVFVPSYRLNWFEVSDEEGETIRIRYFVIAKQPRPELTPLQRALILGRKRSDVDPIPPETLLPGWTPGAGALEGRRGEEGDRTGAAPPP
jgi:UDP-2,3-diacylglucosamine pyrophosphatase LpxH